MKNMKMCFFVLFVGIIVVTGCATTTTNKAFQTSESQVQLRSIQTRAFDMTDKTAMMQAVISTMQDLDFVIEKADYVVGSVTGSKFHGSKIVKITVIVRPRGNKQLLVRANAQYGIYAMDCPEDYQDFFITLGKSLFLKAHKVD